MVYYSYIHLCLLIDRYKCKRQAKEKAMAETNHSQVRGCLLSYVPL